MSLTISFVLAIISDAYVPQDRPLPSSIRVHVASTASFNSVAESFVLFEATESNPQQSAVVGADGWAWFPDVPVGADSVTRTVRIERVGFLPYKGRIEVSEATRATYRSIVPDDIGCETPLIRANQGGRFDLAGLGVVRIAPNVLSQDVKLRLIPVPVVAWSDVVSNQGNMRYQMWLTAYDQNGMSAHSVVPAAPGSITVELAMSKDYVVPDNAVGETWMTHCLGDFSYDMTSAAQGSDKSVIMPLGRGHNCLYHTYSVETSTNCYWGPWSLRTVQIGQRVVPDGPSVPVICGVHSAGCSYKISGSKTISTTIEFEEQNTRQYGVEGKSPMVAKVSAEVGFTSTFKEATNTVESVTKEQELKTDPGNTVSGRPAGQQPPGYDCINATLKHGMLFRKFRVEAFRYHTCGLPPEVHTMAIFEVYGGLTSWYEGPNGLPLPQWDTNCGPNCNPPGQIPGGMPLKPQ